MRHIIHDENYDVAILIKDAALNRESIEKTYITPFGLKAISFSLDYGASKKPSAKCIHAYLAELLPVLQSIQVTTLLVADGEYFKKLCKVTKSEPHYGYVLPVAIPGFEHMNVCLSANYQALYFNPDLQDKISLSLNTLKHFQEGSYTELGVDIIKEAHYPNTLDDIKHHLNQLNELPELTCDIEAFSLKHYDAGIGTISFGKDTGRGVAFSVDYVATEPEAIQVWCRTDKKFKTRLAYGRKVDNLPVRALLKEFFENYKGKLIYHGASYDVTVLIYVLWMEHLLDQEGLLKGLDIMAVGIEDTLLMTYLATNSCAGNKLGLKDQAHVFAGNYAEEDIKDIRLIPEPDLLKYNLVDSLSTWYTHDKHKETLVQDEQVEIYALFKEFLVDIIQMQLTGMCLDMPRVLEAEIELAGISKLHSDAILAHPKVVALTEQLRQDKITKDNLTLKTKVRTYAEVEHLVFNPNSGPQLQVLLYDVLKLPIVDLTKTHLPATGGKTLIKLKELTLDADTQELLQHLIDFIGVAKILNSFIPAFKEAPLAPDGYHYLFGSFKLGGTVSGRLSSSNPNLQQIPSGSTYAKVIKSCFIAPPGWLMVGADFNALEDRINTLLTRDPNKEIVLLKGFDGHSFRTYHFWPDKFAHIDPTDPVSINTIEVDHKADRSNSKPVHFAMQYLGTYVTLMTNCGFTEPESRAIEANYQNLYRVSFDWVDTQIKQASKVGYATAAFGLRIRCPVLAKSIVGSRATTRQAAAEGRTLGNAVSGQSYGLLNNRSGNEFLTLVRSHEEYRLKVKPGAQIHDAQYYYIKDDLDLVQWVNLELPQCMAWQELPELIHDEIKLPANLDIYYPTWKDAITLPNNISKDEMISLLETEIIKRKTPKEK